VAHPLWEEWGRSATHVRRRFLAGEPVAHGARDIILRSWERSRALGVDPDRCEPPYDPDIDLEGRLVRATTPVLDRLAARLSGTQSSVHLADDRGKRLLRRVGEPSMIRLLDASNDAPGFCFAEHLMGTTGLGLALAERHPVRVLGGEHFAERCQVYACVTFPVRDPLSGNIEGYLDFAGALSDAGPGVEGLLSEAARAIEERLLEQVGERERALLRAYLRATRQGREPGVPVASPAGSGALLDGLRPYDRLVLRQRAAELIASGRRTTLDVPLPSGRTATLLCRPVADQAGTEGLAVEAVLSDGPPPVSAAGAAMAPVRPAPGPPAVVPGGTGEAPRATPAGAPGVIGAADATGAPGAAPRLLALGEPGIGRIAVAARRRLGLLSRAAARIGTTLDVGRTAGELAETAVPELADFVAVDLLEPVLRGEVPDGRGATLRRAALHGARADLPVYPVGGTVEFGPATPQARCMTAGRAVLEADLHAAPGWQGQDPARARRLLAQGTHSLLAVPLLARGTLLGVASFYRREQPEPFGDDDTALAEEFAARAALSLDNARRYTREHTIALTLQRSLLPGALPDLSAVEVAHRYLPAQAGTGGVGGDWFDVIPLSGARVALVLGDVVGHGLHAAVTMGRLRTAVRNFAALDLSPDELLARLDDLVIGLDQDRTADSDGTEAAGATCVYAVYDPVSRRCTVARAGHPLPAVVHPDGAVYFPEVPAGPPLGLGGLPFETCELLFPEGSRLVLYSDGLIEDRDRDVLHSLDRLSEALARPGQSAEETCEAVVRALPTPGASDDVTLLVARTRALDGRNTANWEVPAEPAAVPGVRAAVVRRLSEWGLDRAAFTTELVVSELLSNAIRHARGPIRVRLLHDRSLICEVSDGSSTSPHLRRAALTDEGGRGLFLIAQLVARWGTRYTDRGKVIWTEQPLDRPSAGIPLDVLPTALDAA